MKKTALLAIMFAAVLCSCSKEKLQENNSGNEQTITAYVNAATSKLAFTENEGSGMTSVWEEGDSFYAIQDGQTTVQFTLVSGQGTTGGVFQTTTTGVTETTEWVAVLGNAATVSGTTITCAYLANQTGKLADLDNNYYIAAKGTGLEPTFDFQNGTKMSYIIRVKLPAGVKTVEFTPSAYFTVGADGVPVEKTYNSITGETNALGADKTGVITLDEVSSAEDTVYINVPAIDYSATRYCRDNKQNGNWETAVVITVLNGTETDATASNGTIVAEDFSAKGGKIATLDMSSKTLLPRPKPADAVLITNTEASVAVSTNFKQAASVSTFWAPFSIGASSSSETGNYYSFGEIIANKPLHSFPAYTLRHTPNGSNSYDDYMAIKAAKLVADDLNTTFYTVAGSRYDVARVLWGTSWRLPYAVEGVGLFNKVEKDGTGLKFTGENGNSVHFERTGFYKVKNDSEGFNDEKYVEFWTADKNNRSHNNAGWNQAIVIYANAEDTKECSYGRYDDYGGLTVRPVLVTSTIAPVVPSDVNSEANAPTYGEDE